MDITFDEADASVSSTRTAHYTYFPLYLVLRDKDDMSWEEFNAQSLPTYFQEGLIALRAHVDRLEDLSNPHTVQDDKNLWFMVESLLQARHLIDDLRHKSM
jgi:hypothetical protein